jgi:hypothetical protein
MGENLGCYVKNIFFSVLGFELRVSYLLSRPSYPLSHSTILFLIFEIGSLKLFAWG